MSSNESITCSAMLIKLEVGVEASESDGQIADPKRYENLPIEIKEMIIKYSFCDWDLATHKLPSCIRLRGTAADVFYKTYLSYLCGMQIKELAKIPQHVFQQIRHLSTNFRTDLLARFSMVPTPRKLELRALHIYQGIRPTYCEIMLWSECRSILEDSDAVQELSLTFQLPASIYVDRTTNRDIPYPPDPLNDFIKRKNFIAIAVPRINAQMGIEGEGPEDVESRDDLTWVWKASGESFLQWSGYYKTIE